MLKIFKYTFEDGFKYYEAKFNNGNLIAYSVDELMNDLTKRYGFKVSDVTTELFSIKNLN